MAQRLPGLGLAAVLAGAATAVAVLPTLAAGAVGTESAAPPLPRASATAAKSDPGVLLLQRSPASFSRSGQIAELSPWQESPHSTEANLASLTAEMHEVKQLVGTSGSEAVTNLTTEVQELKEMIKALQHSLEAKMGSCCKGCQDGPGPDPVPPPQPPSTSTNRSTPEPGLCAAFGDPHFTTFDGAHTILLRDMTLWLVKSEDVWIQASSKTTTGDFMGLAVGGPFMNGHTLILYNNTLSPDSSVPGSLTALFDGKPILADWDFEGNADFEEPFTLWAARRTEWNLALHDRQVLELPDVINWTIGSWPSRFQNKPMGGLYLFRLPQGIEITATGVDFMSAVIKMAPQAKGQSGYCGNFNNDASDDFELAPFGSAPPQTIAAWNHPVGDGLEPVPDSDNLFKLHNATAHLSLHAAALPDGAPAPLAAERPCEGSRMEAAQKACEGIPSEVMRQACITDVCLTGNMAAADGVVDVEILEELENSRGLAVFVGYGTCVDTQGKQLRTLRTQGVRSKLECQNLLASLHETRGILGAQLRVEGTCEIVVSLSADLEGVVEMTSPLGGGWATDDAPEVATEVSGEDYVAGVADDLSWSCWRLN